MHKNLQIVRQLRAWLRWSESFTVNDVAVISLSPRETALMFTVDTWQVQFQSEQRHTIASTTRKNTTD